MELNERKCKEMLIDFRRNRSVIPPISIGEQNISCVKSYKLLGLWLDDDLKWNTNTEYITTKAAKRLFLLKILKSYGAPKVDLLTFYCTVIRSVLEYGAQVWSGGLTQEQRKNIERIKKRALRIIYPQYDYNQALIETKLQTLEEHRDDQCATLIKKILQPSHKLHGLLPKKPEDIKEKETRANGQKLYNFYCKTDRFKHSTLVHAIDKYNFKLMN